MTAEQELLDTLEEIRKQRFPDVPSDLVRQVAMIERDFTDNRPEAYRRVSEAIDAFLENRSAAGKAEG